MTYPGQQAYPGVPGMPQTAERPTLASPAGGGEGLSPRNLIGRACLMIVRTYDANAQYGGNRRPTVTADVYVLDGGPLSYGDQQRPAVTPPTMQVQTPAFFSNVIMSGGWADRVGQHAGTNQPIGGRWRYGDRNDKGNPAIMFVELGGDLDPQKAHGPAVADALIDLLMAHRGAGNSGKRPDQPNPFGESWTPPTPVSLIPQNGAPVGAYPGATPAGATVNYGPPKLPGAPSLPGAAPALPQAPVNPGWDPRLTQFGWSAEQWAGLYPGMSQSDREQWAVEAAKLPPV